MEKRNARNTDGTQAVDRLNTGHDGIHHFRGVEDMKMNIVRLVIGTTAEKIVGWNAGRTALDIANLSATAIVYWGTHPDLTVDTGYPLFSFGEAHKNKRLGDMPESDIYAVSDTASTGIAIAEVFE